MNSDAINALADYLSDPVIVVHSSISLQLPPVPQNEQFRHAAEMYFAIRRIFNVRGYASKDEARGEVAHTLARGADR